MLIFWRYLLKKFFSTFFLITISFITLLLVIRLKEIARYIALGANGKNIFFFIYYQIPIILPYAIPISCLISSFLLFYNLYQTNELVALKVAGLPLKKIVFPVVLTSIFLTLINFFILSEVTTRSNMRSRELLVEKTTRNPLLLLTRKSLSKMNNSFMLFTPTNNPEKIHDLLVIVPGLYKDRLSLVKGKTFLLQDQKLFGHNVAMVTYQPTESSHFDTLFLENEKEIFCEEKEISLLIKKNRWRFHPAFFPLAHIFHISKTSKNKSMRQIFYFECLRKAFLASLAFSFTLIGVSFGMQKKKKNFFIAALCVLFLFACSFIGKQFREQLLYAAGIYLLSSLSVALVCFFKLRNLSVGKP